MDNLDCIDLFIISLGWTAAVMLPVFALHGIYELVSRLFRRR